jgi:hypothetical protein
MHLPENTTMETVPLLACFLAMLVLVWPAYLEDILDSLTFWLAYCLLLVCVYFLASLIMNRKISEVQMIESCRATAAEQATPRLEALEGLQANNSSLAKTVTTLRRDITASRHREAESSKRAADHRERHH